MDNRQQRRRREREEAKMVKRSRTAKFDLAAWLRNTFNRVRNNIAQVDLRLSTQIQNFNTQVIVFLKDRRVYFLTIPAAALVFFASCHYDWTRYSLLLYFVLLEAVFEGCIAYWDLLPKNKYSEGFPLNWPSVGMMLAAFLCSYVFPYWPSMGPGTFGRRWIIPALWLFQ